MMAVYGNAGGPFHASRSCAPAGADQFLAELAVEAGLEPCGLCKPEEPDIGDAQLAEIAAVDISDERIESELDDAETVADLTAAFPEFEQPSTVLRLVGRRGFGHRIATTHVDRADVKEGGDE